MKKSIILLLICFSFQIGTSQKIYFEKNNYKDSLTLSKNMPLLAKKVLPLYKNPSRASYLDYYSRIQSVAGDFKGMHETFVTYSQEILGDSIANRPLGFVYKTYGKTALKEPKTKSDFEKVFTAEFYKLYNTFNTDGKSWAEGYYELKLSDIKNDFETQLKAVRDNDSISVENAAQLCRQYSRYFILSKTLSLAHKIIAKIEAETYIIDRDIIITLPNGSTISATMVRLKNVSEPQPVVMKYNIYAGNEVSDCKEIANMGYVGFVANTRGKRLSNDPIEPYEHDGDDAYHILDWVSKQPWCNGKIGLYGGSYLGFSQWSAVKKVHPALKTIVPLVSVGAGIDFPMQNGIFMSYALKWIHLVTNTKLTDLNSFLNSKKWDEVFTQYYKTGASFGSLDKIEGNPSPLFQRWLEHPAYDSYWQNMTPQKEAFANINIPILSTTGYYDDDQLGAMYYYNQYQKYNKSDNYYLIIGPYDHGGSQGTPRKELGGYTIDEAANIPINAIIFEWFDHILKGAKRPEILKDKVNFEIMGKNEWKSVSSLDKMHNENLTFYLSNNNSKYSLQKTAPKKAIAINQTVDLTDRSEINIYNDDYVNGFPKVIDSIFKPEKHLLVFESDPLENSTIISGSLKTSLKISTNKKDIDVEIQLYEKTAKDQYFALTNNLQRASFAKDRTKRQLLTPNKIETIDIEQTFIISKELEKGSSIVIVLGVNKNPNWEVNYGSGKNVSDETIADAKEPLQIKWYSDSTITIPILKL
ncbi:CocE/NonD family hydrolase [Flavobacterium ginsenosidimutans]|uniref:CocE/NonD family hydrolase n=1 Tax=Flavobacterium ginsenosidimutans TaxID=687844 RepID=A0ABZ2Q7L7_9FLAO|nr:CocE/NonD family hydrolase [Flavobacterium ginsenosidimutans]KAF2327843.1 CocE/NonD family hydrolase [Flavobacterium ginsenosidimutans]